MVYIPPEIKYITCESGDWKVLIVNGKLYHEGHDIPEHIWLELLEDKFDVNCKNIEISDDDMLERTFETEVQE